MVSSMVSSMVMSRRGALLAALVATAALLAPAAAEACAVCYGNAESPVIEGTKLSIVFMVALTYLLLGGGIAGFLLTRRHRLRAASTQPASGSPR
jgi:hypothetical protein